MKFLRKEKGFTLIELLVVVAIVGILVTIILNSLNSAKDKALITRYKSQLQQFRTDAEIYNIEENSYDNVCFGNQSPFGRFRSDFFANYGGGANFRFFGCKDLVNDYVVLISLTNIENGYHALCIDARQSDVVEIFSPDDPRPNIWSNTHCR